MESHQAPEPIEMQPMGVPADSVGLNHPHYLRGIEAQTSNRPPQHTPVMSKKTRNIILWRIFIVSSLALAMAVGATIGVYWDPEPAPATSTTLSPVVVTQVATVSVTTTVTSTYSQPFPVFGVSPLTTITVFVPPATPTATVPFEASLRLTLEIAKIEVVTSDSPSPQRVAQ